MLRGAIANQETTLKPHRAQWRGISSWQSLPLLLPREADAESQEPSSRMMKYLVTRIVRGLRTARPFQPEQRSTTVRDSTEPRDLGPGRN